MVYLRAKIGPQTVSIFQCSLSATYLNLDSSHPRQCYNAVSMIICDKPAFLTMDRWYVRAPTVAEVKDVDRRVRACFQ
jgi:hypothetical protein